MAFSVFDHPFLSGLFGDEEIGHFFSAEADVAAMLSFESALVRAESEAGLMPDAAADVIGNVCETFEADMERLREATARDGVVVPELVRQLRKAVGAEYGEHVHFGSTSQDAIDTSLALRMRSVLALLRVRMEILVDGLNRLDAEQGANRLMGRTRMQAAIPIHVADRIAAWRRPIERRLAEADALVRETTCVQLGGPVGTLDKLGDKGPSIRCRIGELMGLNVDDQSWHNERDRTAKLADWMSLVTGGLGKFGQDIALMAQNGLDEVALSGGGGSSAMAHKHNPVAAETLVTFARFNAAQLSGMHQALVHEQERSGASWALEWMLLPPMIVAAAASLRTAIDLVASVQRIGSASR